MELLSVNIKEPGEALVNTFFSEDDWHFNACFISERLAGWAETMLIAYCSTHLILSFSIWLICSDLLRTSIISCCSISLIWLLEGKEVTPLFTHQPASSLIDKFWHYYSVLKINIFMACNVIKKYLLYVTWFVTHFLARQANISKRKTLANMWCEYSRRRRSIIANFPSTMNLAQQLLDLTY